MTTSVPYLPAELWEKIGDYKNALETKDKHNALTKDLIVEVNKWASRPFRRHFTNDVWWWMSEDEEKVVRREIQQCRNCGHYEEFYSEKTLAERWCDECFELD